MQPAAGNIPRSPPVSSRVNAESAQRRDDPGKGGSVFFLGTWLEVRGLSHRSILRAAYRRALSLNNKPAAALCRAWADATDIEEVWAVMAHAALL